MNSGFWLSAAVLVSGTIVAAWLLPERLRVDQVIRADAEPRPAAEPVPVTVVQSTASDVDPYDLVLVDD